MGGLDITKKVYGGGYLLIGEWDTELDTPPAYPTDYFDPGDVKKVSETIKTETIEDTTWYNGTRSKLVTDVIEVGYELDIELGQVDQDILAIALMGEKIGENEIYPLTKPLGVYAIKFVPRYPRGQKWDRHFWKCNLVLSGARDLISDKYQSIVLKATGLIDDANHATNPWFGTINYTA